MKKFTPPKVNLESLRKIFAGVLISALLFVGGYYLGRQGFITQKSSQGNIVITREVPPDKNLDFSLFWRVWDILTESYLDKSKLVISEMVYGSIKGMVSALGDPYTVFLSPQENRLVQEDLNGDLEGVGIQIGFKGTQLTVIAPLAGTPAEAVGIKTGDAIVGIKDENKGIDRGTAGITLQEAVLAIRGPKGSMVTLVVLREGADEPLEFNVTRARIDTPSVELEYISDPSTDLGQIAHIELLKFTGDTFSEWNRVVAQIVSNPNVTGVILDLRNNPGGYLQGAVDIAGEFLSNGELVVIEELSSGTRNEFRVDRIGRMKNYSLVVLVNKGTASASEILAGALRDNRGILILGEDTFGKGTIQEPLQLENGSALHITTAKWLLPGGDWINETGMSPDTTIADNLETEEDEQLQKAIDLLNGQ